MPHASSCAHTHTLPHTHPPALPHPRSRPPRARTLAGTPTLTPVHPMSSHTQYFRAPTHTLAALGWVPYLARTGPLSRPALGCLLRPVQRGPEPTPRRRACRWAAFRKRSAPPAPGAPPSTTSTVRGLPTIRYRPPWWGSRSRSAVPGPPGARFALAWAGRPSELDSAPPPAAVCRVCSLCALAAPWSPHDRVCSV